MRFRKADYEILAIADQILLNEDDGVLDGTNAKKWSSFYERVLKNEAKPKAGGDGLSVRKAIDVIKGILGKRCVLPAAYPLAGKVWFIQMQNKLNSNGVTEELMTKATKVAASEWKGKIRAESVIRSVDTLLTDNEPVNLKAEAGDMDDL